MQSPAETQVKPTELQEKLPPRQGAFQRLLVDILFVTKRDKKWWLLPIILLVLTLAGLLAFVTLAGPLAPFIYPLL